MMNKELLSDIFIISPMIALFAIAMIPVMIKVMRGNREPSPAVTLMYGFLGITIATLLTAVLSGTKKTAFSNALVMDGMSVMSSYLVYFITGISLMLSFDHVLTKGRQFSEYMFLMMSSAVGMLIVLMSNDLIVTFIGIEMMSLCLYILVAMSKEQTLSKEASFKYFILGSFASAIFLYGIAFIYGTASSATMSGTYFPMVAAAIDKGLLETDRLFLVGICLVVLGFGFKVSIFPLHAWTPDVYQGAPTPVTAFMSTAVKAATFIAFLRLFNSQGFSNTELTSSTAHLQTVMMWLAVLTMTIGNVAAIMQNNIKRMLAYSSVAHSGYIMIGLIAAGFGGEFADGAISVLFYLISYAIMTVGAFALIGLYEKYENSSVNVSDLKGAGSRHPVLAISLSVIMLSLAGIPPTLGFFGKFYIFTAAIEHDMYWLALWGVINSVISVYYYLRPVVVMYMGDEPGEEIAEGLLTRCTVVFTAFLILVMGILSAPVFKAVVKSIQSLS